MKPELVKRVEFQLKYFLFQVAVDIFTVVLVGKLIEPLWGALEMMTFFFIVNTGKSSLFSFCETMNSGVAVLCAIFYYLLYMVTENVDLLFQV